ncbi:MAG: caspase family protein [Methylococcales bacterium]
MCYFDKFSNSISRYSGGQCTSFFATLLLTLLFSGCVSQGASGFADEAEITPENINKLQIVDCLLPGQVRQMGQSFTYVTARRPVRTTAANCEVRGGEYVAFDRANYATALKTWQPKANEGDAEAQFYVGEIYEKGLGISPDYDLAALWYRKAAEQGYSSAMVNLGYLYEKGFGVPQDSIAALNWYRKAAGLENTDVAFSASVEQTQAQIESLRQESAKYQQQSEHYQQESAQLRQKLDDTRQQLQSTQQQLKQQKQQAFRERQSVARMREQLQVKKQASPSDKSGSQNSPAEIARYELEIKHKEAELLKQQQMIGVLENEAMQQQQTLSFLKEDAKRFAAVQTSAQMDALRQESAKYQQQSEQYQQESAQLRQKLDDNKQQLLATQQQLKQQKQNAFNESQTVQRMRKQLQEKKLSLSSEHATSQNSLAEIARYEQEIKRKEAELLKQQQMIGLLENEAKQQTQTLNILKEGAERFAEETSRELSDLRTKLSSSNTKSLQLEAELQQSHQRLDQLHFIITEQNASLTERERNFQALRKKLLNKKKAAKTPKENAELDKLTQALIQRERELQAQRDKMAELNFQWKTLSRQDQIKQEELKAQSATITELQARIDRENEEAALAESATSKLAKLTAPHIEIIDPPLIAQRGTRSVNARADIKSRTIIGKVHAPGGLVSLIVNDVEEVVDAGGVFKVNVPLTSASTLIQIAAIDKNSKRSELKFIINRKLSDTAVALGQGNPQTGEKARPVLTKILPRSLFGKYHALLIGNNTYQKLPHLDTAINDAKGIADVLQKQYGFKTKVLLNATRYDILKALNNYRKLLTNNDNLLIYYAGHGILDEVNDRGHWLPVDAEPDSSANWISVQNVTDQLKIISAKHVLVVADSCYSGALTRSSIARLEAGMTPQKRAQWIKLMLNARSRVALSSGGLEPVLDGGGGNHSIFAKALIDTLSKNNDLMESQALYRNVSALVADAASDQDFNQVPEFSPIRHAGHAAGEFFFYPSQSL